MDLFGVAQDLKIKLEQAERDGRKDKIEQYLGALEKVGLPMAAVIHSNLPQVITTLRTNQGMQRLF